MPVWHKSVLLKTPACRNYPHGRTNWNRMQNLVPQSNLSWELGREVHAQETLSWLLRLSEWIKPYRKKRIQLVNSTMWLNKQFPRWKKNLARDAFGIPGQHAGEKNKAEIVPGEYVANVTLRPVSTEHYSVPGGYSLVCRVVVFLMKKRWLGLFHHASKLHTQIWNYFFSKISVDNCKLPVLEELWLSKVWRK